MNDFLRTYQNYFSRQKPCLSFDGQGEVILSVMKKLALLFLTLSGGMQVSVQVYT
ncbi:MAG: hypothetical protein LBJ01_07105 [Tannerella sp.]|nr:hypothetical protein [Tannerella sp.]